MLNLPHRPLKNSQLVTDNTLHVITVVSNPVMYHSRYRLYEKFAEHISQFKDVNLITVECAYGDRNFEVTDANNPNHLQVRTSSSPIWLKEPLINLGIRKLPLDYKYVGWLDADIEFLSKDWDREVIHCLQLHEACQPYETCLDLNATGNVIQTHKSFASQYVKGVPKGYTTNYGGKDFYHPGFGFFYRKSFIENVGGMIPWSILGSADHLQALAMLNDIKFAMPGGLHPNFYKLAYEWQDKCVKALNYNIGYVNGSILHSFHGSKNKRYYESRWDILTRNKFDPVNDLHYEATGLIALNKDKVRLRDDILRYFKARNEDSLDE